MVAAVEGFERLHRELHFEDREPAGAGQRQAKAPSAGGRGTDRPPGQETTIGTSATAHSATIQRSAGKIVNRKVTVSVSTIIRSTKFAVIISTWYLSCDSSTSTAIITSDSVAGDGRPAQQREPEEIQECPRRAETPPCS
jgi:hypothetical protein